MTATALPLVELELATTGFAGDWNHCDQVANYLAQLVAHDRADSFLYANLLSTVLNELLEVIFARHSSGASVRCTLSRSEAGDRLEFLVPADADTRAFYEQMVADAQSATVSETYTRFLLAREVPAQSLGFLELAADYGAQLSLEDAAEPGAIQLVVQVRLDDGTPASPTLS